MNHPDRGLGSGERGSKSSSYSWSWRGDMRGGRKVVVDVHAFVLVGLRMDNGIGSLGGGGGRGGAVLGTFEEGFEGFGGRLGEGGRGGYEEIER